MTHQMTVEECIADVEAGRPRPGHKHEPVMSPVTPAARRSHPVTSHTAAASVQGVSETHAHVLALFHVAGAMTDVELRTEYDHARRAYGWPRVSDSGLRTRRSELVTAGLLTDTPVRRLLPTGRKAVVWALTDEGAAEVARG